ncbi:Uncharacterised protein [Enterobacter cloacae]|nr:Uncharacterised protein [Enterobacter cloacae]
MLQSMIIRPACSGSERSPHAWMIFAFSWKRSSRASAASSEKPRASRLPVSRHAATQESV